MFTNKQLKINTQVKRVFIHLKAERHCSRLTSTTMPFLKYMDGFSAIKKNHPFRERALQFYLRHHLPIEEIDNALGIACITL